MATTTTPQNTRQRILAAAEEVFAERGYEGAALADIARRAGFTTGAIYGCFRDKAELLLEVVRSVLESQQEAAVAYSRLDPGDGALPARVAGLADQFVDEAGARQRALVLEAHVAARRDPEVGELLRAFQAGRLEELTRAIERAQEAGEVDAAVDAATVATLFLAIPLGVVVLDAAGVELPSSADWAEVAQHMTTTLRPHHT
jgi:AcrR family transcriptional regulator